MSLDFAASTRRLQERGRVYTDQRKKKLELERLQRERAAAALLEADKARRPVEEVDEEAVRRPCSNRRRIRNRANGSTGTSGQTSFQCIHEA